MNFGVCSSHWIRISISNTNPDPGQPENADPQHYSRIQIQIQVRICYPFYIDWNKTPKSLQSKSEPYFFLKILHSSELDPQKFVV
jgi:hypothetical protein